MVVDVKGLVDPLKQPEAGWAQNVSSLEGLRRGRKWVGLTFTFSLGSLRWTRLPMTLVLVQLSGFLPRPQLVGLS